MNQDNKETTRPASYNDSVENYLNFLRKSAVTNMFGASHHLMGIFDMTQDEAHACLAFWMLTFKKH